MAITTGWSAVSVHAGRPAAAGPAVARAPRRVIGQWPGLDGLRAIAVAAVVVYHLSASWLPGGFLGVDVFFVLSGFLITSLLVDEWQRCGRIDIRRFYLRRARRLFPALYLMLATVVLVTAVVAPAELGRLRGDVVAALTYVTNWTQILWSQSYFQALGPPSLLEHLWSLAVEEQFYLVWPVVLVACLASSHRRLPLGVALAGVAASSLAMAALYSPYHDPSRVYYGSDTHAAPVLIGAALALARADALDRRRAGARRHRARHVWPVDLLAVCGALVLGYCLLAVRYTQPGLYHGGFVVVAIASAAVVRAATLPTSITSRLLSAPLLRWIGVRSYAIYLWHWPIIQLTRPGLHPPLTGIPLDVMRVALSVGAAAVSYRYVEQPIRTRGFLAVVRGSVPRTAAVARVGGAVVVLGVVASVGTMTLVSAKTTNAAAGPAADPQPRPTITFSTSPRNPSPRPPATAAPTSRVPTTTAKPPPPFAPPVRVGFFGDSQGMTLLLNRPAGLGKYLTLADDTIEGCGILGGIISSVSGQSRNLTADCGGWQQKWAAHAAASKPQIAVVEIGAWEVFDLNLNGVQLPFGSPQWDAYFNQQLASGIQVLLKSGAQVALLSVPCYQPISAGGLQALPERGYRTRTSHLNTLLRAAAAADPHRVFMVNSPAQFCNDPKVVGNTAYRWDGTHFYIPGAALEFQVITPQLLAIPQPPRH